MNVKHHEQLLQTLSAMLIELHALKTQLDASKAVNSLAMRDGLDVLEQMTREALYTVRSFIDELPPAELEGVTLADALSRMIEETAEQLGLSSRVAFSGIDEQSKAGDHRLSALAERLLFFVARETFLQIGQHSGARRLRLNFNYGSEDVQMSIEDDGINTNLAEVDTGDGIEVDMAAPPFGNSEQVTSMAQAVRPIINDLRSRLEHMGGSLVISTVDTQGTRVVARMPYTGQSKHSPQPESLSTLQREQSVRLEAPEQDVEDSVRILIVDSQAVTRAGLHRLLETYAGLQIVGEAADGVQAVSETLELGPRVVLMDAQLPEGQSLEALRQIKQLNLETRVLLFAAQDREEYLYETLRAGADGYILKDIVPDELVQAIRAVARGEVLIQPQLAGRLLSRFGRQGRSNNRYDLLTARELEVLRQLARGLRNKEIAARLYVSERTVNFHLANIYQKLNVSGRTEALSKALEQGLITA